MAAVATNGVSTSAGENIPQWKKDLIARLKNQNKKSEERLWIDHHTPHHHPKTDLVCPMSPENGFGKQVDSPESSDSEDLHYGPGIVNRLRNKYLSLALRESNTRPTILRKATSLENLLDDADDDNDEGDEGEKEDMRRFTRRGGGNDGGNRYRSSNRRNEMKRARSVEVISRTSHEEELTMTSSVTAKINNRQSLHEDMLIQNNEEKGVLIENTRPYKKPVSIENGTEDSVDKFSRKINRPKRIPPLLNEREKPPVDVVKHAKMIFEKRPETRTKKPHHTGEVAAKVDSFNDIIVKTKVALKSTKPAIKISKPVLSDKPKSNTHHHVRPAAKPVILNEEIVKPKNLELSSPRHEKNKGFNSLPSPIPDVSRVDIKHQDGSDPRNNQMNSLCETPDLILTSSPIPKITSPTYRKRSTENFITEERNRSFLVHMETSNKYVSPIRSPTRPSYAKPTSLNFNMDELDSPGIKMISPISQSNITKSSATSVFNFINAQVDQRHLPSVNKNLSERRSPTSEQPKPEVNGFSGGNKIKMGLSSFEMEKNMRNAAKSASPPGEIKPTLENKEESKSAGEFIEKKSRTTADLAPSKPQKPEKAARDKEKLGEDPGTETNAVDKSWQNLGSTVEKTSNIFENLSKPGKTVPNWYEPAYKNSEPTHVLDQSRKVKEEIREQNTIKAENITRENDYKNVPEVGKKLDTVKNTDKAEKVDRAGVLKPVQNKSANVKSNLVDSATSDEKLKIVLPKKTKPRVEESTIAVFNFTSRKDVPDYIANDTSRTPTRPVIPKPDEPGIKLLPEALLTNFKEIQEVWEEDELIRSLEARPPSPCDVTFINDNILIDGKSSLFQHASKRLKLKISFIDDADIFEYPSEASLLLDESPLQTLAGSAQVGHTVPTLSGSSLATYTPKTTEEFQLGVTKSFQEPAATPIRDGSQEEPQTDVVLEEVEKPVQFSSGSTSDILF